MKSLVFYKRYYFSPKWLPTVATIIVLCLLVALGCWQLSRAQQKQLLQDQYIARSNAQPINLNELKNLPNDLQFSMVKVTGYFDNNHVFLLDNKFFQHRLGYQIISPFIVPGTKKIVLINRGWIEQSNDRKQLPHIQTINKTITLQGIISVPAKAFSLGTNAENQRWPRVIQNIELNQIAQELPQELYPFIILLSPHQPYGFARDWQPFNGKVTTHYGYAFQWFALALTLLIIFLALNIHRKKNQ